MRVGGTLKRSSDVIGWSGIGAAALFFVLVGWVALVRPALLALPDDFHYEAQVISLDDLYDEAAGSYAGEKRSVSNFSYDAVERRGRVLIVDNDFEVRSIEGDRIFSVRRSYGIDRVSRRHVPGHGDHDRQGYLFGPRHAGKRGFAYWHVNYDRPMALEFKGEENLLGLRVYRYEASAAVDQTADVRGLPGVPDVRGIEVEVRLQVWIEPVSGRMVKYEDSSDAFYYDRATGQRLHPWNRFSNRYTRQSIIAQVGQAKLERSKVLAVDTAVPGLLLIGMVLLALYRRYRLGCLVAGLVCYAAAVILLVTALFPRVGEAVTTVGIAVWSDNPEYGRNVDAFKDALAAAGLEEGRNLRYLYGDAGMDERAQRDLLRSFMKERVDLVYSLSTQGTFIASQELSQTPVVFSAVTYPVESGLVASLGRSGNNLVGVRDWVSARDQIATLWEIVPRATSIGFVRSAADQSSAIQVEKMRMVARRFGFGLVDIVAASVDELPGVLAAARGSIDVLYTPCDSMLQGGGGDMVADFARKEGLPDFTCMFGRASHGSLFGAVADQSEMGRRAGEKAALLLAGVTPSAMQTETISKPYLFADLGVAESLGIIVPQAILTRADLIIR